MSKAIRVLIVDDSMLFTKLLKDKLSTFSTIDIVGTASNAFEAESQIMSLNPDVITLDVEMPKVSGIEFLKSFLKKRHIPAVMVSAVNMTVFEALQVGAVDFVKKPGMGENAIDNFIRDLATKIFIASVAKVKAQPVVAQVQPKVNDLPMLKTTPYNNSTVIALGASTGGTEATLEAIKNLPENTPGIVIVQHMPEGFTNMYAKRLDKFCKMRAKEAENGDIIERGQILVAPGGMHLAVRRKGVQFYVEVFSQDKVSGHRPSVDVLFQSVAETVGKNAVGIILTGMGQDGAQGLLAMRKKGAYTIGQSKESCLVYGMPMVAYNIGAVETQVSCEEVSKTLIEHLNKQ